MFKNPFSVFVNQAMLTENRDAPENPFINKDTYRFQHGTILQKENGVEISVEDNNIWWKPLPDCMSAFLYVNQSEKENWLLDYATLKPSVFIQNNLADTPFYKPELTDTDYKILSIHQYPYTWVNDGVGKQDWGTGASISLSPGESFFIIVQAPCA